MASMSMTTSLLPRSSSGLTRLPSRSGTVVAKAFSTAGQGEMASLEMKQESSNGRRDMIFAAASNGRRDMIFAAASNGRRDMIFAAAAAAVCSFANVAMGEEPERGTPEAKKKYAPICVTMPTAKICRK